MWCLHVAHSQQQPSKELVYSLAKATVESGDRSSLTTVIHCQTCPTSPVLLQALIQCSHSASNPGCSLPSGKVEYYFQQLTQFSSNMIARRAGIKYNPLGGQQKHIGLNSSNPTHQPTHTDVTHDIHIRYLCLSSCGMMLPGMYIGPLQIQGTCNRYSVCGLIAEDIKSRVIHRCQ